MKIAPWLLGLSIVLPAPARATTEVSIEEILAMATLLPPEGGKEPAGYGHSSDAKTIAAGIAAAASSREEAALLLTYAAYESSLTVHAVGDGGASRGPWQLKWVPDAVAYDPALAAKHWLWLAHDAQTKCAMNTPDEQLALLASGSCARGRSKVRRRAEVARKIAGVAQAK